MTPHAAVRPPSDRSPPLSASAGTSSPFMFVECDAGSSSSVLGQSNPATGSRLSGVRPRANADAEGSEEEIKNNRHLYGIRATRGVGYGLWEHAVEVTFA